MQNILFQASLKTLCRTLAFETYWSNKYDHPSLHSTSYIDQLSRFSRFTRVSKLYIPSTMNIWKNLLSRAIWAAKNELFSGRIACISRKNLRSETIYQSSNFIRNLLNSECIFIQKTYLGCITLTCLAEFSVSGLAKQLSNDISTLAFHFIVSRMPA